jgi:hypothetical protein
MASSPDLDLHLDPRRAADVPFRLPSPLLRARIPRQPVRKGARRRMAPAECSPGCTSRRPSSAACARPSRFLLSPQFLPNLLVPHLLRFTELFSILAPAAQVMGRF